MPRGDGTGPIWGGGPGAGRGRGMGRRRGLGIGRGMGRGVYPIQPGTPSNITPQVGQGQQLKAFVDEGKCISCGACARVCRTGAITIDNVAKIDLNRCIGCGDCVGVCPTEAIILKEYLGK